MFAFSDAEPYYTDGTEAGTQKLKELETSIYSNPFNFVNVDNTNFFFNTYNGSVRSIYQSDGTEAGTIKIVNDVQSEGMAYVNGILFFVKRDATNGTELWKWQSGTASLVKNINPGTANSFPSMLRSFNNQLYFFATTTANGQELWKSDGTDAGTTIVADVNPGTGGLQSPYDLTVHNGALYYLAYNGTTRVLVKTDGTAAGTSSIKSFTNNDDFGKFFSFAGNLFFGKKNINGSDQVNLELWKTDGTEAGTVLIKELLPYTGEIDSEEMHAIGFFANGNQFFFFAERENFFNETSQINFWRSDGTIAGTTQLKSFTYAEDDEGEFEYDEEVRYIASFDANNVLFTFPSAANGEEIWKSDGTPGGTNLAIDIIPGTKGSKLSSLTSLGSAIYFSAAGNNDQNELWKIAASAPLPLKLLSFSAVKDGEKVQLRWKTSNEIDCSHFVVQKSNGIGLFNDIERVAATNTQSGNYATVDFNPYNGVNFYRLQMFDNDGRSTFSQVVKIDFNHNHIVIISPNPATDFFDVKGISNLEKVVLVDMNGRQVKAFNATTTNRYFLDGLQSGSYIVQFITSNNNVTSAKLIIK